MIDQEMKDQLKEVFAQQSSVIELRYYASEDPAQAELLELLQSLTEIQPKIQLKASYEKSPFPRFDLFKEGRFQGIRFSGIPGGHEFTSLIMALLHADGKGKWPDTIIEKRIRALKGPIRLKTYISLSCENCPDVVQALNQMSLLHSDFQHEMIDGAYTPEDIKQLGIQGVPSVIANETLLHSGRADLLSLIEKLEQHFGKEDTPLTDSESTPLEDYDVVVIGGGPAGASAAIYSARKGLKTAVLTERVGGQVQETKGIENFISIPYTEGPALAHQLEKHMKEYPVRVLEHRRVKKIETQNSWKTLHLESGETIRAASLIIATGAKWRELGIPGEKEYIGRGVAYCPHCDGPYYKGKSVAVVGGGNSGVEAAIDLAGMAQHVTLFEFQDQLKADQVLVNKLEALPNVTVIKSAKTQTIKGDGAKVIALEYENRQTKETHSLSLDGVFVQIGLLPNSSFAKDIVKTTPFGEIIVDEKGRTSAPGIYAAGDVTTVPYKQIIIAMGEGAKAALAAFEDRMHSSHQ